MFSGVISNQSSFFLRSFLRFGAAGIVTKKDLWQTLQALQHWRVLYHGVIQHTSSSWKTLRLWRVKNPTRMCFKSNAWYNHFKQKFCWNLGRASWSFAPTAAVVCREVPSHLVWQWLHHAWLHPHPPWARASPGVICSFCGSWWIYYLS